MRLKIVLLFCYLFIVSGCGEKSLAFLDDGNRSLSEFQGKWLFVNYWAAWCKPCLAEIPELNIFSKRENVEVLAFNYDHLDDASLRGQVSKLGIQYHSLVVDPSNIFDQSMPSGLPATMVIDPEGHFIKWLHGAQSQESLAEVLVHNK